MSDVLSGLQSVAEEEGSSASPIAIPRLFINDAKLNEYSSQGSIAKGEKVVYTCEGLYIKSSRNFLQIILQILYSIAISRLCRF